MKWLPVFVLSLLLNSCSEKEKLPAVDKDAFPSSSNALPTALPGKWIRTSSLRTFDYKADEWVVEPVTGSANKYLQLNADKTYSSNQLDCSDCKIEYLADTLYIKHSKGFYKFPVLALNDTLLHLRTKTDDSDHSLPNTGLFDFILEEKYRKQ